MPEIVKKFVYFGKDNSEMQNCLRLLELSTI